MNCPYCHMAVKDDERFEEIQGMRAHARCLSEVRRPDPTQTAQTRDFRERVSLTDEVKPGLTTVKRDTELRD